MNDGPSDDQVRVALESCGFTVERYSWAGHRPDGPALWEDVRFAGLAGSVEAIGGLIAQLAATGEPASADVAYTRPGGGPGYGRLRLLPAGDEGGAPALWAVFEDRTAEHLVALRARVLGAVIEQSTELITYHGPVGHEARINPAGAAMVGGVDPAVPIPGRVRDLFVKESARLIDEVGVPEMNRTGSWRGDVKLENRLTGEVRDIDFSMFLLRNEQGEAVATAGMGRDVSERLRAEAALHAAGEEARSASQAKSRFISRMSHELRTPLNAILGFAQLLEIDEDGAGRDELTNILQAGAHMLRLIDDALELATLAAGRLHLTIEPVSPRSVLQEVTTLAGPLAVAAGLELRVAPGGAAADVRADPRRLKQVLLNLLSNAIKYNRAGGTVAVEAVDQGDTVCLRVSDTGIGIKPELLPRLFDPFDRLGAEATEVEGAGLGLSVARELVTAMHGTIDVVSEPGAGSTFAVTLPAFPAGDRAAGPAPASALKARLQRLPAMRALYIEDNPLNRKLVVSLLGRTGQVEVTTAVTGLSGLELARKEKPDVVLLDVNLPDIDGAEVLERLQADPSTAGIPVVVLTADAQSSTAQRLIRGGAQSVLHKPLDLEALAGALEQAARTTPAPAQPSGEARR